MSVEWLGLNAGELRLSFVPQMIWDTFLVAPSQSYSEYG